MTNTIDKKLPPVNEAPKTTEYDEAGRKWFDEFLAEKKAYVEE